MPEKVHQTVNTTVRVAKESVGIPLTLGTAQKRRLCQTGLEAPQSKPYPAGLYRPKNNSLLPNKSQNPALLFPSEEKYKRLCEVG